jgi:hypothetical protein
VDLGAVPPLPEIVSLWQFAGNPLLPQPLVIEGGLHRECKMILDKQGMGKFRSAGHFC